MIEVGLKQIKLRNFRSFVQPTQIDLSNGAGLKLISGDNQAEPRLGGNGCGKSTLWDAVCFALYGTSIKGLRASDLISYGHQHTVAELVLTIDGTEHYVSRTAPPGRIYHNGRQVEQPDIDRLIGLSKERFCHSVVFGQAVPLFIDLPVPQRGDLLDEVLGLELWLLAAEKATAKAKDQTNTLTELRRQIAQTQGQLEGLGDIERWRVAAEGWDAKRRERLEDVLSMLEAAERQYNALQGELQEELRLVDERGAAERLDAARLANNRVRVEMARIQTELEQLANEVQFLDQNDICPTCHQRITQAHKDEHNRRIQPRLDQLEKLGDIAQLDIQTTLTDCQAHEATWRGAVRENQQLRTARTIIHADADRKLSMIDEFVAQAERIAAETNPHTAEYDRAVQERDRLTAALADLRDREAQAVSALAALDFWKQGFRRVRLFCLDRVLQELTLETRNSLLALGLGAWGIQFKTATETKAGTLRLGVQVEVQAPQATSKFDNLSGGEGQRARLAVSLGLANLIQRWAGVRFNFEVYDEPTAWLSEPGVEDLLDSLQSRADAYDRSVWVCDHRAHIYSGFSEIMRITKTQEGSQIRQ